MTISIDKTSEGSNKTQIFCMLTSIKPTILSIQLVIKPNYSIYQLNKNPAIWTGS